MTALVDIVNFNADASCLSAAVWLDSLKGGDRSPFCQWLALYTELGKKVTLGLTGATVADLRAFNPEAIALINAHRETFEIIARPFSHDISLLRSREGFLANLDAGWRVLSSTFTDVRRLFLPPEFMLTNEQVALLVERGYREVVVNAARFSHELQQRIPVEPYVLRGIAGRHIGCLPVLGAMTQAYLDSIHQCEATPWLEAAGDADRVRSWRDGESSFLIPDGIRREAAWLSSETGVERVHIGDLDLAFRPSEALPSTAFHAYPVHSFTAWMKEFRMLGYVNRLQRLEDSVGDFDDVELALWLQAINSDVLSAVEKTSPTVTLKAIASADVFQHVIYRSERGFEGEEYLVLLECLRRNRSARDDFDRFMASGQPHAKKLAARMDALRGLRA